MRAVRGTLVRQSGASYDAGRENPAIGIAQRNVNDVAADGMENDRRDGFGRPCDDDGRRRGAD
jgi:hypothetical protein